MRMEAWLALVFSMASTFLMGCQEDTTFLARGSAIAGESGDGNGDAFGKPTDAEELARTGNETPSSLSEGDVVSDWESIYGLAAVMREEFLGKTNKTSKPVDVVFVMDTSGSMDGEKQKLQQSMAAFTNGFVMRNAALDFQIFMVGENFTFPSIANENRLALVNQRVESFNALTILRNFLVGNYVANIFTSGATREASPRRLRSNARTEVVIVSDDNAKRKTSGSAINADEFLAAISGMTTGVGSDLHINGIVGQRLGQDPNNADCNIVAVGTEYMKLAQLPRTSGKTYDLCVLDWNGLLGQISNSIVESVTQLEFPLKSQPISADKIQVIMVDDGKQVTGFSYDAAKNQIVFPANSAPAEGAKFRVIYVKS